MHVHVDEVSLYILQSMGLVLLTSKECEAPPTMKIRARVASIVRHWLRKSTRCGLTFAEGARAYSPY